MPGIKPSFVRWFPQDWLLSPKVNRLSLAQQAVYFRLLLHAYLAEDGAIPDDPNDLNFMSGGAERSDIEQVLQLFEAPVQGRRTHAIVRRELLRMMRETEMMSERGKRGGEASGKSRGRNNKASRSSTKRSTSSEQRSNHDHYHDHYHDLSVPPPERRAAERGAPSNSPLPRTSPASGHPGTPAPGGRGPGAPPDAWDDGPEETAEEREAWAKDFRERMEARKAAAAGGDGS